MQNQNQQSLPIPESFSVVEGDFKDGTHLVGSINFAYKEFSDKASYPWCLKVAIALDLDNLYESKLPKDSESRVANELEDKLRGEIEKLTRSHYIGHIFNDTFLDFYMYLDEPEKVHQYLQTQINKEGLVRGFGYEINNDPNWEIISKLVNI